MSARCSCPTSGAVTLSSWTTCPATSVPASDLIEAAGARLMFLPPYSPDFNPIEKAFARLKALLRKAGERTVSGLWSLLGRLVDLFQPQECANYFSSCGYDPD